MGYFDSEEHVREYFQLAEGYDGRALIERLKEFLPAGSSVLELGMGPGVDLDILRGHYKVTGSDASTIFLDHYRSAHPDSDLLQLDAETLSTDRTFDALYSNKVLQHLDYDQMRASFLRQIEILDRPGILMHSFWYGEEFEKIEDLLFYQVTEKLLRSLLPAEVELLELRRYTEMEEDDSLFMIGRVH